MAKIPKEERILKLHNDIVEDTVQLNSLEKNKLIVKNRLAINILNFKAEIKGRKK